MYTGKEAFSHLPAAKHNIQTLRNPSITKAHNSFTNIKTNEQEEQKDVEEEQKFFKIIINVLLIYQVTLIFIIDRHF